MVVLLFTCSATPLPLPPLLVLALLVSKGVGLCAYFTLAFVKHFVVLTIPQQQADIAEYQLLS